MDDASVEDLLDALSPLGELRARRMFGGVGLYCDGVFFGLIMEDALYFKVDEANVAEYQAAGMKAFQPYPGRPSATMGYFEVPLDVQERRDRLVEWAARALAAARSRDASKATRKSARRSRAPSRKARPVQELTNIGPKIAAWLRVVGIETSADLERVGAVPAYRLVLEKGYAPSSSLLYALEGARLGLRSDLLSEAVKKNLRERAGKSPPERSR